MSDLIPEVDWADFKLIVEMGKVGELKSCEVKFNGQHIYTAEIPHGDMFSDGYTRTQAEYLAIRSNIVGGKDPLEILDAPAEVVVDKFPNLTRAREVRKAKREKEMVKV